MELDKAKETIKTLAEGVNPATGEVLPKESPYNDPIVIRALFTVIASTRSTTRPKKTNEQRQQDNIAAGRPRNAGLPWTDESRKEVATKFRNGTSVDALSQHFERTKYAIEAELVRQGLIEPREVPARR